MVFKHEHKLVLLARRQLRVFGMAAREKEHLERIVAHRPHNRRFETHIPGAIVHHHLEQIILLDYAAERAVHGRRRGRDDG